MKENNKEKEPTVKGTGGLELLPTNWMPPILGDPVIVDEIPPIHRVEVQTWEESGKTYFLCPLTGQRREGNLSLWSETLRSESSLFQSRGAAS